MRYLAFILLVLMVVGCTSNPVAKQEEEFQEEFQDISEKITETAKETTDSTLAASTYRCNTMCATWVAFECGGDSISLDDIKAACGCQDETDCKATCGC